uniref:Ig-like domain-containing protein n=1 Tax=Rhabditophanes sp. KR3021 TaxID=114890 RepID=A0AC35U618_9BILA
MLLASPIILSLAADVKISDDMPFLLDVESDDSEFDQNKFEVIPDFALPVLDASQGQTRKYRCKRNNIFHTGSDDSESEVSELSDGLYKF